MAYVKCRDIEILGGNLQLFIVPSAPPRECSCGPSRATAKNSSQSIESGQSSFIAADTLSAVKKMLGKQRLALSQTRRMSYIHRDDETLTAMDELWEARRQHVLHEQQSVIAKVVQLTEKQEEWRARQEVKMNVRMASRAVEQKETIDREIQWRLETKIRKEKEYQERIRLQVRVCDSVPSRGLVFSVTPSENRFHYRVSFLDHAP